MKRIMMALGLSLGALVLVTALLARSPTPPDHVLFYNGVVRTVSEAGQVEALYMRDGVIVAVGDLEQVESQAPRFARRVDLKGGALTPGLIEPHTHPLANALLGAAINVSGPHAGGREEILQQIETGLARSGPSPWAVAFGWDPVMVEGLTAPSLAELDALSPERPLVILTQMMHEAFANSAALNAAGITANTPDPHDGYFERDETGALTGRVVEVNAISQLMDGVPAPSDAALTFLLASTYADYARAGYTTVGIAGLVGRARDPLAILAGVAAHERPAVNTVLYLLHDQIDHGANLFAHVDESRALARVNGVKFWLDGSPFVGGAATAEPYADTAFNAQVLGLPPGWRGPLAMPESLAAQYALDAQQRGDQIAFHVQGERAIDLALDVIEQAQRQAPRARLHHRLEHLALATPEQIARARGLNVSLGFFPDHIGFYGDHLADMFGADRADRYMPIRAALESGVTTTLHGDHPGSTIDAARVMALPVTRRAHGGTVLGDPVAADDAFAMMTINAARQLLLDEQIGSLEPGKRADLVWFDRDPVSALEAGEPFEVQQTWVNGRRVDTRAWSLDQLGRMLQAAWGQMTL